MEVVREHREIEVQKVKKKQKERKLIGIGLLYLLPAIVFICVFLFYPILKTLYFSLFNVKLGGVTEDFVGLKHYLAILSSADFGKSLLDTLLFVIYTVPAEIIISLFLAVLANEKLKGMGFFRTIFSSTLGVSVAVGSTIWLFLFNPAMGVLNEVLGFVGITGPDWLTSSTWALPAIALTTVWMHIGINFIILLGGLQNVPEQLYESARIDGAGYWSRLMKITVPLISPTLFFVIIIAVISSFQTFGQIDILTQGGPANSTNVIVYSIYQQAFSFGNLGTASSEAIVLFIIVLIATMIQFRVGEKKVHYQ